MDFRTGSSFQLEASQSIHTSSQAPFLASSAQSKQLQQPIFGSVCDTPCYKGVERLIKQRKDAEILQMHISVSLFSIFSYTTTNYSANRLLMHIRIRVACHLK